jgi:hypothetical protein
MKECRSCKQVKEFSFFNKRSASVDGFSATCKQCKHLLYIKRYKVVSEYRIKKVRARTIQNQEVVNQIKTQQGCQVCGLKDFRAWLFDFDHLGDKKTLVSRMVSHKLDRILEEAAKCQVLCSNCHRQITYERLHNTTAPVVPKKATKVQALMKNWEELLIFKSRPCMDCGKQFHFTAMDCDHRDPSLKRDEPSDMARNNSLEALIQELEKCDLVCSNCHRIREHSRKTDTSKMSIRELAKKLMVQRPGLSYQRAIREIVAQQEVFDNPPKTMKNAYVKKITNQEAAAVILKYEWLGTMGRPQACYGLFWDINSKPVLGGVVCFGRSPGTRASDLCGPEFTHLAIALERGACVHWAPKNAASWFIPKAIELASKEFGWKIFYAYSDPAAGEIGTIYQACNWIYLGIGPGHGPTRQKWIKPDGKAVSSRTLRYHKLSTSQALELGWKKELVPARGKYVWFEGGRRFKKDIARKLKHPTLPYPKR